MSTFIYAYWYADFFGKLIFLGLFALSIATWIFLINKIFVFSQVRKFSNSFRLAVEKHLGNVLTLTVDELPKPPKSLMIHPYAHIYVTIKEKTTEILDKNNMFSEKYPNATSNMLSKTDIDLIASHAEAMILKQRAKLEEHFYILSTTVTLAPFLGLLGTVWGILLTFSGLSEGGLLSSSTTVIGGLSTALATTVIGLVIAIPALIGNNYLRNASRSFTADMLNFSHFLLSTIELHYRKVDVVTR